jgi:DNA repair photolyase
VAARRWAGHAIAMGTNTDPYQRCEGKYHLTQGVVKVLGEAANPFSILTKSTLILRDIKLLAAAAQRTDVRASLSIGTLDEEVWRLTEPGTPHPRQRIQAVRRLNDAGVPCGVLIAPILPGISDGEEQLEAVVGACVEAGAVSISSVALHLRPGVRDYFMAQLARTHPHHGREYERPNPRPKAEQQGLAARVRDLVDQARGHHGGSGRTGHETFRLREKAPAADSGAPPTDQLSLDLSATS